ncbi:hypothetical protein JIN84_05140 [Luteolibacter yonseiensis]|uniref:Uncharacterized protein n=1 Tax=Luteolibacter yonseiensis TaxID=1144680 RepID=A0A934V9C4_9BACT|nr:hypothetical protein [Luteolibacter yonseiensis]MBK1814988.1 hypothetical protein [Luteolibacter yonseiensis]
MKNTKVKPTAREAAQKSTTLELDATRVAKLRAMLKVTKNGPIEPFLNDLLRSLVEDEPMTGSLFCTEPDECPVHKDRIPEIKEKIRRIIAGDKRLVGPEPVPCNTTVYEREMARLLTIAQIAGTGKNYILNSLLSKAMDEIESGRWSLEEGGAA